MAAAAAPASAPSTAQPALFAALGQLKARGDGSHELTVTLHPAELGSVNVSATVRDGSLVVTVACADPSARAAVADALPSLHHELQQAGFASVDVSLGDGGSAAGHDQAAPTPNQAGGDQTSAEQSAGRHRAERDGETAHSDAGPTARTLITNLDRWL
jgi:flagellar hook-length control protein FliK